MKKLLIALSSAFCIVGVHAQEAPSYQIDPAATANAPWKVGEKIVRAEPCDDKVCYRVFLGVLVEGYSLIQMFYISGNKFTDPYKVFINGNEHIVNGKLIFWYENGQKKMEVFMQLGIKNGPAVSWYENGFKQDEGFFLNGRPIGVWRLWDENGNLTDEADFSGL